jgi:hypothetical protein
MTMTPEPPTRKTTMKDDLAQLLACLKLRKIAEIYEAEAQKSEKAGEPFGKLFSRLLRAEWNHRQECALAWRIKKADLPEEWTLESFPFKRQPGVSQRQIRSLAELDFIAKAENIVFIGPTAVGKTGLASGLLLKAMQNGHRGMFISAQDLFDEMYASLAEGFGTWLDGNPESTAVTEDGSIILPMLARERFTDTATTFGAVTNRGEDILAARVEDGQVVSIDRAGRVTNVVKVDESLVTALLETEDGLIVAAGPPAKLYRVDSKGKAKLLHAPDAAYVWDVALGEDGAIYCALGEPGGIVRVDKKGAAELLFSPDEEHVRSLAYDKELGLFAGGGERGVLYRGAVTKGRPGNFRALYDSGHTEITSVVVKRPFAYVAAVSGAQALASEEGNDQRGGKSKSPEVRFQLVQVAMDGTTEVLAGSNDEGILDMVLDDRDIIMVATGAAGKDDPRGRLYSVDPAQRLISLLYQSPSRRLTHLAALVHGSVAAVGAGGGRITHLSVGVAKKGEFLTTPFDSVINSSFGMVEVFGVWPEGSKVTASVRSGQTSKPDATWSEWSPEVKAPGKLRPKVPNGRYMQVRLTLEGDGKVSPAVHRVRVAYLRQNLRPFVREVVALRKGVALLPIVREEQKSKTISLGEKANAESQRGEEEEAPRRADAPRARQVEERGALTLKWVAEDPNGDDLTYDLEVREAGEREWRQMRGELEEPFYTIQSWQLPDGHYQFRIRATDERATPTATASRTRASRARSSSTTRRRRSRQARHGAHGRR